MYFKNVNPFKSLFCDPIFTSYFFFNSGSRIAYNKIFKKKLRLSKYAGQKVIECETANQILIKAIFDNNAYMYGRFGSEINIVTQYLLFKKGIIKKIDLDSLKEIFYVIGLFPLDNDTVIKYSLILIEAMKSIDLFGTFRSIMEDYYIKYYMNDNIKLTHLNLMDYWKYEIPFTSSLNGKKVLVIHPFSDSIESQYKKRELLFKNKNILPKFDLRTIKAVQTIAGLKDNRFSNWFEALDYMYNEAMNVNFDVALISCGGYGFPLSSRLKNSGKVVIHMGGVLQTLFGIKGLRWDSIPEVNQHYNNYWTRPNNSEAVINASTIENGCFW
jgi:hypothetical protein